MTINKTLRIGVIVGGTLLLAACGTGQTPQAGKKTVYPDATASSHMSGDNTGLQTPAEVEITKESSFWGLFAGRSNPNTQIAVNKYLWTASLDVLNFLPVQTIDPFSGLIVTGYGTPPGGGRAYRATILVTDPALDARSLKVSLESKGGAVSPDTVRAVEDAILTRARQLRIADGNL